MSETEAKFNKETGEFEGELSDRDVYNLLIQSKIITEDLLTFEEFLVLRDFLDAGYSEEEAFNLAKGFGVSQKYRQTK